MVIKLWMIYALQSTTYWLSKYVFMFFRPSLNITEILTCTRVNDYGRENVLKIGNKEMKKVDKVKFLGIIIDNNLNWEPRIQHMTQKLKSRIIMIKRIIKLIPTSEYMNIYDALFKYHLCYCISSWVQYPSINCKDCLQYKKYVLHKVLISPFRILRNLCPSSYLSKSYNPEGLLSGTYKTIVW